jgi:hypothetical protein
MLLTSLSKPSEELGARIFRVQGMYVEIAYYVADCDFPFGGQNGL